MGQRRVAANVRKILLPILAAALLVLPAASCKRTSQSPVVSSSTKPARITVASLVPAATDLMVGMGAADHLVAVSNWDADQPEITALPRVGDYRNIDWEKLSQIHPDVIIVQYRADKMPQGLAERCAADRIRLVNVTNNHLDELFATIRQIGQAIDEPSKAAEAERVLRGQLDAVKRRVAGKPVVRTLMTRSEGSVALASVGGGNFLDDLLTIAGGENVLAGGENSYPTIDREQLLQLNPQVVLALLPASPPQVVERTREFWKTIPQVVAVWDGRVHLMTDSYLLVPGLNVGRIAEQFAEKLHPEIAATTQKGEAK